MRYKIREIKNIDNPLSQNESKEVANIITTVLVKEYKFVPNQKGSAMGEHCFTHFGKHYNKKYNKQGEALFRGYFVIEDEKGEIIGGCGYGEKKDETIKTFEVQRMYLLPEAREKHLGSKLLDVVLQKAFESGYEQGYLDTRSDMVSAQRLYISRGFKYFQPTKDKKPIHPDASDIMMYLSKDDWLATKANNAPKLQSKL